ncbi:substrate-binding domain-containing protein [Caulobacter sp. HMWF009]|nr:substrate-binding domain-containing protein [Caulobacter sp. HMWF009]PTS83194.1 hypothetical protein DBR21_16745 [Caulobacter sp. HMWF009]
MATVHDLALRARVSPKPASGVLIPPSSPAPCFPATCMAARKHGLRIPDDLSLAGLVDAPIAAGNWPSMTIIRQPIVEMAQHAMNAPSAWNTSKAAGKVSAPAINVGGTDTIWEVA